MNVTVHLKIGDILARRPCGCFRHEMSDIKHFWKYNRVRYWFRGLRLHLMYISIMLSWWWRERLLDYIEWANPIFFFIGMVSYSDAQDKDRAIVDFRDANKKRLREKLFLGADSDCPEGVYARNGWDMACMTEDESRHW